VVAQRDRARTLVFGSRQESFCAGEECTGKIFERDKSDVEMDAAKRIILMEQQRLWSILRVVRQTRAKTWRMTKSRTKRADGQKSSDGRFGRKESGSDRVPAGWDLRQVVAVEWK
jgi:hypothetical protein